MPNEDTKILKYCHGKNDESTICNYTDLQRISACDDNSEKSYPTKRTKQTTCGGDNCLTKSCDKNTYISLKMIGIEHKITSSLITEKVVSLKQQSSRSSRVCYLCEEEFNHKDKSYRKKEINVISQES